MRPETYRKYVDARAPRASLPKNCLHAFLTGGLICGFAEGLTRFFTDFLHMESETAGMGTSVFLILVSVILTGIGWFDRVAKFAGAGTLVPITGFANAVVSPAIDSRSEGLVLGVGAKIFTVAGPVLLYGTLSGVLYGVVYAVAGWVSSL